MIIEKVIGSGLEHELIQFLKMNLNLDDATSKLFVNRIQRGEFSVEDPEKLKKLEEEFKRFIKSKFELDLDSPGDIKNQMDARNLAIQNKSNIPGILSVVITIGFFSVLGYMLFNDSRPNETLLIMLGSLGTAWIAVVNYWFGSSSGSAYKNTVIEQMSKR